MVNITVSLRFDEDKKIKELMKQYRMKRHEVVKFALRRFLFPEEENIPLNGRSAHMYSCGHMDVRKSILKKEE